jgi:hypothetical protein
MSSPARLSASAGDWLRLVLQRLLQQPPLKGLKWLLETHNVLRYLLARTRHRGMYEVLAYETTLELKDRGGKRATFKKRQKVRYLQDNVITYQDQAWGDGEILVNYRCSPGTPVDRYRSGHKTHILISRREVKNRGDTDEYNIEWDIRQGFLRRTEQWETHVKHPTRYLKIDVIFPKSRPPRRMKLIEGNRQRGHVLGNSTRVELPDDRWLVTWETRRPRLHENYILEWDW